MTLLRLNKKDLSTRTGLFTGHCPSKYHLKKMGKLNDEKCRFCGLENETSEHLLCECIVSIQRRLRILKGFLSPSEIWNESPSQILHFIRIVIPDWDTRANQNWTSTQ